MLLNIIGEQIIKKTTALQIQHIYISTHGGRHTPSLPYIVD
ncbi:hypothetical protein NEILACOT_05251 [Neisseria lactamica ATCC 23970]|uniref:Uncharacterized protein n=1 Tax=Neisseria lactamica ATCC 23970 TaxID=546265 RepID=D0WCH0_NEILA|nr:hypothetical protein NEILACOT_05251 [Neisseria lactamica ATCC 23970]